MADRNGDRPPYLNAANAAARGAPGECVFCSCPASRKGDHAPPRWFLRRFLREGPFTFDVGQAPVLDRDDRPRTSDHMPPVLVPVCDHHTEVCKRQGADLGCNQVLDRLYEKRGKPAVLSVMAGAPLLDSGQVEAFSRWVVKTMLLVFHPAARDTFLGDERRVGSWALPLSAYPPLVDGAGTFPDDFSVWMAVSTSPRPDDPSRPTRIDAVGELSRLMRLPLLHTTGPGGGGDGDAKHLDLAMADHERLVLFAAASHPRCDLEHPFENAGLAVRLWPSPADRLDPSAMPLLTLEGRRQFRHLFVGSGMSVVLPADEWRARTVAYEDGQPLPLADFAFVPPEGRSPV
jgi:hypothetical protein